MDETCRERDQGRNVRDTFALAAIASRQHGLIGSPGLRALGWDRFAEARMVRAGRLHVIHPRVLAVGHPGLSVEGRLLAATMAIGPASALSFATAAYAMALVRTLAFPLEVTVASTNGRASPDGLRVHRTRRLHPWEVSVRSGIRATTPARTLIDLASRVPARELDRLVDRALAQRLVSAVVLREYVARAGGRPGAPALRSALERVHPEVHRTRSELERAGLRLIRGARLPRPRVNARRGPYELDLVWESRRVVVELDVGAITDRPRR